MTPQKFGSLLLLVVCMAIFAGCATKQEAELDIPSLRRAYDAARTIEYDNVTVEEVEKAAARIFELVDGDYGVIYGKGGVIAHRERFLRGAFSSEPGDYWYVQAQPSGDGVVMRIRRSAEADPHTSLVPEEHLNASGPLIAPETIDPTEMWVSELTGSEAVYGLFFKRMEWMLGINQYWLYCRAGEEYAKMEKHTGTLDPLCVDCKDRRPTRR